MSSGHQGSFSFWLQSFLCWFW